ncbi:MAG: hypothetical protein HY331_17405 [Chloroflexi bacterium]|nr:hypothetical protein [Chloroflexota bacterium]
MEGQRALKTLIAIILGFKLWGILLIVLMQSDAATLRLLFALNWPYLLGLAGMLAGFALVRLRLLRARARRAELRRQEWNVE